MTTPVAVLGSSGSIGTQTLEIIRADPERYRVTALGVGLASAAEPKRSE